jgi:ABC-type ATPase with predicted acetyltransferase domain
MSNWTCFECGKYFKADGGGFSTEDPECPHCGAGWEDIRELACSDDYDHECTVLW